MRERVGLKSPVRENCTPGSVRGASGNRRPYRDAFMKWSFATTHESRESCLMNTMT